MFQTIPVSDKNIFAFKAVGKLTHDDYHQFLPTLEALIDENGPISVLLEFEDFHGWETAALIDDYKFGMSHQSSFERIAILGEKKWQHWVTVFTKPFVDAEVRYFHQDDFQQAWDWLRKKSAEEKNTEEVSPVQNSSLLPWKKILVATDFSTHAEMALKRAVDIAAKHHAQLAVIHAVDDQVIYNDFYDSLEVPDNFDLFQQRMDYAKDNMQALIDQLDLKNIQTEVVPGRAKPAILNYAEAQDIDLIVMGTHGRKGLARLIGSTTNGVINAARCDVLSVALP